MAQKNDNTLMDGFIDPICYVWFLMHMYSNVPTSVGDSSDLIWVEFELIHFMLKNFDVN